MKVPVALANIVNANNRVYPKEVLEKAVADCARRVERRTLLAYKTISDEPVSLPFSLKESVGIVNKLEMQGNQVVADVQFLSTPDGKKFEDLVRRGEVGFVTSGVGSVVNGEVQSDFQLCAIVAQPIIRSRLQSKSANWRCSWRIFWQRVWDGLRRFAKSVFTGVC